MRSRPRFLLVALPSILLLFLAARGSLLAGVTEPQQQASCDYWVAPPPAGNDGNPGSQAHPWATLQHAAENIPDAGCTVWFAGGVYTGEQQVELRLQTPATFKSITPYAAVLENDGPTLSLRGARNLIFEGFEFRHSYPATGKHVIETARKSGTSIWTEHVTFRNNIIHDSYNNDLLKIQNGSRFITVENNVFYNQDVSEQHMDVNSVTDVIIQDNIFFNDFAGSGRANNSDTKHFIVIKDSNEAEDGLEGSERVTVRRNVFLNWQGESTTFIQLGNDGKAYHEAKDVLVENNLLIGNAPAVVSAPIGMRGVRNVVFRNNTVTGDLPAKAYGLRAETVGLNPQNENISFFNNVWSDATGTMGADGPGDNSHEFSNGDPTQTSNIVLDNNLYWNGGAPIPPGDLVSPLADDGQRVVADPLLATDHSAIVLPRWNGATFLSGNTSIRDEFMRLVEAYGRIPAGSPAVGQADPAQVPGEDILGRPRPAAPALGAYEYEPAPGGTATPTSAATATSTATSTPAPSQTPTNTPQPTATNTAQPTPTGTPLPTSTATSTVTPGQTATNTPQPAATNTPLSTGTATSTATPSQTPTDAPGPTATKTPRPTNTPRPTKTPRTTPTDTPEPTATGSPEPTITPTISAIGLFPAVYLPLVISSD